MMAGLMAEKAGNVDGAVHLMQQGLKLAPEWAPGIIVLAQLQARQGQFPEAKDNAAYAIELDSQSRIVLDGAVEVAHVTGVLDVAVRYVRLGLRHQLADRMRVCGRSRRGAPCFV